ncbi:MAG: NAD(P)-dependent oxidoreductase [Acidobacteriota bacterium]
MSQISFLGLGAMGSRMARHLLHAGHDVVVYNRTLERTTSLATGGARVADTPRDAADGADIVLSMVRDDEASRALWLDQDVGAIHGLGAGSLAIEASTSTPAWINSLDARVADRGAILLDAPVVGSRPQADAGSLIVLVGGPTAAFERARTVLEAFAGTIHHVGPSGHGATLKLAVNALFGMQVAALAETVGWIRAVGLDEARAIDLLAQMPITSPALRAVGQGIVARRFAPHFPIELVEKDFRYVLDTARSAAAELPSATAAHATFERAVDAGHGGDNIHGVAQLFL